MLNNNTVVIAASSVCGKTEMVANDQSQWNKSISIVQVAYI